MSKLLDRMERIDRGGGRSMGFGAAARAETLPAMVLLGTIAKGDRSRQSASLLAKIGADGALLEGMGKGKVFQEIVRNLEGVPWGIKVEGLNTDQADLCKKEGCDFLAFGPEQALVGAMEDEDTGYVLCIPPDMDERSLRAIEELPIDAVLLRLTSLETPLTLQHLIDIGSVRSNFNKYLLLEVPVALTGRELEGLRDMGVDGLVVDANTTPEEELGGLRERLLTLPRRQRDLSRRPSAILPHASFAPIGVSPDEDEEEED